MKAQDIVITHNAAIASLNETQIEAVDRLVCAAMLTMIMQAKGEKVTVERCLGYVIDREADTSIHMEPNFTAETWPAELRQ